MRFVKLFLYDIWIMYHIMNKMSYHLVRFFSCISITVLSCIIYQVRTNYICPKMPLYQYDFQLMILVKWRHILNGLTMIWAISFYVIYVGASSITQCFPFISFEQGAACTGLENSRWQPIMSAWVKRYEIKTPLVKFCFFNALCLLHCALKLWFMIFFFCLFRYLMLCRLP